MGNLAAVHAVWLREFIVFRREKSRVVSSLVTPVMWLLIVGSGIGSIANVEETGVEYRAFIFPGIVAMSVLFGTVFYGLYIVWDRKVDVLKEILVAPVSRTAIFFGKVLGGSTDALLQAVLLLLLGFYFVPGMTVTKYALALAVVFLTAIALTAMGLTIGSFFDSFEGFQVTGSFLIFPMFFLSGALYPVASDDLPAWLMVLSRFDPVTYSVDALRGIIIGGNEFYLWQDFVVMAVFAVAMILVGTWAFGRMKL